MVVRRPPLGKRVAASLGGRAAAWARFTWGTDTHRVFGAKPLPHVLVNWIVLAACIATAVTHPAWWEPVTAVIVLGLIYTIGRAARHLPARRKTLEALVATTTTAFRHPRSTRNAPIDPSTLAPVARWSGAGKPRAGAILYSADAPAGSPTGRAAAERSVESALTPHLKEGSAVVFVHDPGKLSYEVTTADDDRVTRQQTRRWVETVIHQALPTRRGQEPTTVDVDWADPEEAGRPDAPSVITVGTGSNDTSSARFRDDVESTFDSRVQRGLIFTYDWSTPGLLTITGQPSGSPEAVRKITARKISDVTVGAVNRVNRTAAKNTTVEVLDWLPEDAKSGANTPFRIQIDMGTADFSAPMAQYALERALDQALEQQWPDRVWLPTWSFGASTTLTLDAVPTRHEQALQKRELHRLRQVVQDKFPPKRGQEPPDVEVDAWALVEVASDTGAAVTVARARHAMVRFGTVDVSQPDTRMAFEAHFDSLTDTNDWRYEWSPAQGQCEVTAVPVLPSFVAFPEPGTREFEEWNKAFRDGRIYIGPAKGGYRPYVDLSKSPHVLVGGSTGKGKSVLLTLCLFGVLWNPDMFEMIMVDPKVTDFTWVGGYPNVLTYAPTNATRAHEEIAEAVKTAMARMQSRQDLLGAFSGVRNLRALRKAIRDGKIDSMGIEEVPKRLLIMFDEGGSAYTPVKDKDAKEYQDASRTDMENIAMLGRAMEVNIVMAAQKPSKDNIGTALRAQLVNKIAVGVLDPTTSQQVLGNTLASDLLEDGSPIGRGIFVTDTGEQRVFQTYYLPDDDEEVDAVIATPDNPTGPPVHLTGVKTRVAARLEADGWQRITRTETMTRIPESGPNKGQPITFDVDQEQWVHPDLIEP